MMLFAIGGFYFNESVLWCGIGGAIGLWILFRNLHITSNNIQTDMGDAFPILLGTLALLTSAITFYITDFDSPIDTQRVMMIISWVMLAARIKVSDIKNFRPH